MGPRCCKAAARPPQGETGGSAAAPQAEPHTESQSENDPARGNASQPTLSINDQLYDRLERLTRILANCQPCSCPIECLGPDVVNTPSAPPEGSPRTPRRPVRCREVSKRSRGRARAVVLAEALGSTEVELPRLGDTARGTLRMSLQVHTDPYTQTRRGYYGELYLGRPGEEEEEHIGFIESWLILRPTAQRPDRSNEWVNDWLRRQTDHHEDDTVEIAHSLSQLYTQRGEVRASVSMRGVEASTIRNDLGPQGTEIVYMPIIWISENYSGNGIIGHAFNLFYRLLTGGTLNTHNIGGRVTFILEPGQIERDDMTTMWRNVLPQRRGEGYYTYANRITRRLRTVYEKYGYRSIRDDVMARTVEPQAADPRDQLRDVPDPPPCVPGGETPSSTVQEPENPMTTTGEPPDDSDEEGSGMEGSGVEDSQMARDDDSSDYDPSE